MENNTAFGDLRIIFMGTPEFAVASLDKLVQAGCNIVGVITAPDKPGGRGMQLQQSAVKKYALDKRLYLLQPEKLKNTAFLDELRALKADIQVVVAFRMLPAVVWDMPPMGTVNVHGSLLPQYRGAAPINWAIINGEKFTGVTTFKLQQDIDTGDILLKEKISIGENETAGELHDRLKITGAALLLQTLNGIAANDLQPKPQSTFADPSITIRHAPKIFTQTCQVDWDLPLQQVYDLIRGLSPSPTAFTFLENKKLKIFKAEKQFENTNHKPGEFETDKTSFIRYCCSDGYINILELQLEGKKRMSVKEFLRGYHFKEQPGNSLT